MSAVLARRIGVAVMSAVSIIMLAVPAQAEPSGPPPGKPGIGAPDIKPPTRPAAERPVSRPADQPDQEVRSEKRRPDGSVEVVIHTAAPGVTARQLYQRLKARGVQDLVDPATMRVMDDGSCSWGTATSIECPRIEWSHSGTAHATIYFADHTTSAWPVDAAVNVWNQAQGVDSWYRWDSCPILAGTHCVHVWNANYGDNGEVGTTIYTWRGDFFVDGTVRIQMNDFYQTTPARKRKSTCHELGHALGLGHNSSAGSCMISGNYETSGPSADDFNLLRDLYN